MKIYLARHGRTNYNDLSLCNADPSVDVHLTPTGIAQAEALADKLKQEPIECIFISELRRTSQTAEIVNANHNVKIEVDSRLNDGRTGFEGKHFEEYNQALNAAEDKETARFNDGESIEDVKRRAADFINDLRAKDYSAVLIITSQWIVQDVIALVQDVSSEQAESLDVRQGDYMELEI